MLFEFLYNVFGVARVRNEGLGVSGGQAGGAHHQSGDMEKREPRDHDLLSPLGLQPHIPTGFILAMKLAWVSSGALGRAGGAAGILYETDVLRADFHIRGAGGYFLMRSL